MHVSKPQTWISTCFLIVTSLACFAGGSVGDTDIGAGWMSIIPTSSQGDPLIITSLFGKPTYQPETGSSLKADTAQTLGLSIDHFLSNKVSVEVMGGVPPTIGITGTGTSAVYGQVGHVQQWGLVVTGRYHFGDSLDKFRPYLGLGASMDWFRKEQFSNTNYSNSFGPGATTKLSVNQVHSAVVSAGVAIK